MSSYHTSVLLHEAVDALCIESGKKYIDGTLGGGGHTFEILKKGGIVLGIDQDQDALNEVRTQLKVQNAKFKIDHELLLAKGNFKDIDQIAKDTKWSSVSGVLLDIGISSHHVDAGERGFSFIHNAPLDMRMDKSLQVTAADLVNGLSKKELTELFFNLGEERYSRQIAEWIIAHRAIEPIKTTVELADIARKSVPFQKKGVHPATKIFQALRIAVNDELHVLIEALPKAVDLLAPGGRLVVISFHSLEDRIVKRSFLQMAQEGKGVIVTKKPIIPTDEEIEHNPRSRSSKMRVFEKI